MARYGKAASKTVKSAMHRRKRGTLKSGKGGKGGTVKSRKQAIAIGLSEARKKEPKCRGKKDPRRASQPTVAETKASLAPLTSKDVKKLFFCVTDIGREWLRAARQDIPLNLKVNIRSRCHGYLFYGLVSYILPAAILFFALAASACRAPDDRADARPEQAASGHSATLRWAPNTPAPDGYHVYRATRQGGPYEKLTAAPLRTTEYTDTAVHAGQTYYYAVTAVDSKQRESAKSQDIRVTVPGLR